MKSHEHYQGGGGGFVIIHYAGKVCNLYMQITFSSVSQFRTQTSHSCGHCAIDLFAYHLTFIYRICQSALTETVRRIVMQNRSTFL